MRQKEITANKADTSAWSHRQLPFQTDVSDCKELLLKESANAETFSAKVSLSSTPGIFSAAGPEGQEGLDQAGSRPMVGDSTGEKQHLVLGDLGGLALHQKEG